MVDYIQFPDEEMQLQLDFEALKKYLDARIRDQFRLRWVSND